MAREDEIRLIAYSIWESEGCPDGRDCEHWFRAEAIWEVNHAPKATKAPARAAPKPAAKRKTRKSDAS